MPYIVNSEVSIPDAASASFSVAIPAGHAANDLLLAAVTQDGGGTTIAAAGWNVIGAQAAAQAQRTVLLWKIASSSEEPDIDLTGANDEWIVSISVIRGADTSNPINTQLRTDSINSTTNYLDSGTVTTSGNNCLVMFVWGFDGAGLLTIQQPKDLVFVTQETSATAVQIVGYTVQRAAGSTPVLRALANLATEGGSNWVVAINDVNPSEPSLPPTANTTYEIVKRHGGAVVGTGFGAQHDGVSGWEALTVMAPTTIAGRPTNSAIALPAAVTDANTPWDTMTGVSYNYNAGGDPGSWCGATITATGSPLSFQDKIYSLQVRLSSVATTVLGTGGIIVIFQDQSANWAAYRVSLRNSLKAAIIYRSFIDLTSQTPIDSSGVMDWDNIVRIGFAYHRRGTATTAVQLAVKNSFLLPRQIVVGGCEANPLTPTFFNTLTDGWTSPNSLHQTGVQGQGQTLIRSSIQFGDGVTPTYVNMSAQSLELPLPFSNAITRRFWQVPEQQLDFACFASSGDVMKFTSCVFSTATRHSWSMSASSSPLATYDFQGCSFVGWDFNHPASGVTINGATFKSCYPIMLSAGALTSCIVNTPASSIGLVTAYPMNIANTSFTSAGSGHAILITQPSTGAFEGNTFIGYGLDETDNAAIFNNSGGLVRLNLLGDDQEPTVKNGPGATTLLYKPPVTIVASTPLSGSRVQLYNITQDLEIDNVLLGTAGYSFTVTNEFDEGDSVRLRVTKLGYQNVLVLGTFNELTGISFTVSQEEDSIYTALGIDGTAVTEFAADYIGDEVEIDGVATTTKARLYAWWRYNITTEDGIRNWFGTMDGEDVANFKILSSVTDLKLNNVQGTPVRFTDTNRRLYREDGGTLIGNTSGSIQMDSDKVYVTDGGDPAIIASTVWDQNLESTYTAEGILKLMASVVLGASSGFPANPVFKGLDGTTNRVEADLDGDGNRSNIVLDPD